MTARDTAITANRFVASNIVRTGSLRLPNTAISSTSKSSKIATTATKHTTAMLSFEELRGLIVSNWDDFQSVFQGSCEAVGKKLERVRDIRNTVCHFRGPLTPDELDQLREGRRWLERLE